MKERDDLVLTKIDMNNSFYKMSWRLLGLSLIAGTMLGAHAQTAANLTNTFPTSSEAAAGSKIPLIQEWKALGESSPVVPEVLYDEIPLSEVVKNLREEFKRRKSEFDVVLPRGAAVSKSGV